MRADERTGRPADSERRVIVLGAGPAGLTLGNILLAAGIDCVILEQRSREYIQTRQRAGAIEQRNVELLDRHGLADRLIREANPRNGCEFLVDGRRHFLPYADLYDGRRHYFYPQQELVTDLVAAFLGRGGDLRFETEAVRLTDLDTQHPSVACRETDGRISTVSGEYIAGCDGFHGVSRRNVPDGVLTEYNYHHGIGWLGIIAEAPPSAENNVYAFHPRGFAGHMLRTSTISRYFLQVAPDEDPDRWSDERIWAELRLRMAVAGDNSRIVAGPILEKRVLDMRSVVFEPMRYGSLYLAGDAAHIITPVGAKGMNLALHDVEKLSAGLIEYYRTKDEGLLDEYSETCLRRVWRYQEFSQWMTEMIHAHGTEPAGAFRDRMARARLDHLLTSTSYATAFAENYLGLP